MKIAAGAAQGLEYLHDKMKNPIIYRDLKCSNILLGENYHPKLSDFGLAKVGPSGDQTHVSTRVMGTYGYCAPDYAMTGQLTFKSDIYSFGVVLLEIITGRRAIDNRKSGVEINLVAWVRIRSFCSLLCFFFVFEEEKDILPPSSVKLPIWSKRTSFSSQMSNLIEVGESSNQLSWYIVISHLHI